jgi:oxygen-independent coproporphyrinogen III oxidase
VPPVALYIHVPFCRSICPYCDFAVHAGSASTGPRSRVPDLVQALHAEIDLRADAEIDAAPLRSVYLGGGTPSLLSVGQIGGLLDHVEQRWGMKAGVEITLEANPGPSDRGDFPGFRAAGVTRLSIGAQSLDDGELRALGRRHRAGDVAESFRLARAAGFASISIDLLYDVPGQTLETWGHSLEWTAALEPDHVSTYALGLELEGIATPDHVPASHGALAWRRRAAAAQDDDRAAAMDELADELLEPAGWRRYEIANRARSGHESRHNLAYWRSEPYEAIGPGAHAFDGGLRRRWNDANLDEYLKALCPLVGDVRLPPGGAEEVDPATGEAERLMLALRLSEGIDEKDVVDQAQLGSLRWGLEVGVLESRAGRLRLTSRGRLLSNELFARLLPDARPARAEAAA